MAGAGGGLVDAMSDPLCCSLFCRHCGSPGCKAVMHHVLLSIIPYNIKRVTHSTQKPALGVYPKVGIHSSPLRRHRLSSSMTSESSSPTRDTSLDRYVRRKDGFRSMLSRRIWLENCGRG